MAGDCTFKAYYGNDDAFCLPKPLPDRELMRDRAGELSGRGTGARSPNFEIIDGLLYRKKLERGFIHYREVLDEDRRPGAIATFHRRRPGTRHLSLEDTYKAVAENYWWDGMYFHIRDYVLGCPECLKQQNQRTQECGGGGGDKGRVSKTMMSHGRDVLSKLRSQREAGLFCDITLRTDGHSYSAHKAVLAAVSEYFQEAFAEMDSSSKTDIDLTGFSEESLLSLLDFSYSSTLSVCLEDLPEVSTMARHLGMWPAVEACSSLRRDQGDGRHLSQGFLPPGSACLQKSRKRPRLEAREAGEGGGLGARDEGFRLTLGKSDESALAESPRRSPRAPQRPPALPLSPTHRMKLMDFKSPSFKRTAPPRNAPTSSPPSHTRLLRSSPGAAQEVQRLLPRPDSPRPGRRADPPPRPSPRPAPGARQRPRPAAPAPVRVKQEEGEEEEDHLRVLEKYRLMNVLGLQRTSLLPGPEELIGWRQKKRLRKLKVNNYSLTKRRKPRPQVPGLAFGGLPLSLPLCNPANARFLRRVIKTELDDPISTEEMRMKRPRPRPRPVPPSDRSMRSKRALPAAQLQPIARPAFGGRELRRSVRGGGGAPPPPPHARPPLRRVAADPPKIKPEPFDYAILAPPLPARRGVGRPALGTRPPGTGGVAGEALRTVRYNSGRPLAKAKRSGGAEPGKAQRPPREGGLRPGGRAAPRGGLEGATGKKRPPGRVLSPDPDPASLYSHPLYRTIKEEPADPLPVGVPFPQPPSPDLGKRQSKPPVKLLDPGFLFSFCRPAGVAVVAGGVKREEESVDICLTRSVSRGGERFGGGGGAVRVLRARGPPLAATPAPGALSRVKREREERRVSQSQVQRPGTNSHHHKQRRPHLVNAAGSKAARDIPKKQSGPLPRQARSSALLESIRRARLKQLRGRGPGGSAPKAAHSCLDCHLSYRDCDALLMHRIRHIEGKHWPCPLCSKTFFRQKNVRNHIRTHDQRLYRCRSCMAAS